MIVAERRLAQVWCVKLAVWARHSVGTVAIKIRFIVDACTIAAGT